MSISSPRQSLLKSLSLTATFSALGFVLSYIRFWIPELGSMTSGLNEIVILVSVFHLPHWGLASFVALSSVLRAPNEVLVLSLTVHAASAIVAWFFYHKIVKVVGDSRTAAVAWVVFVVVYYLALLLPAMAIHYQLTSPDPIPLTAYVLQAVINLSAELTVTLLITTTYLVALRQFVQRSQIDRMFRAVVEDQTEMIVRWKPDGTRTFVNDAYCRTFGLSREQIIGTSFFPLIAPEYVERVLNRIRQIRPDAPVSIDMHESILADGRRVWQEWTDRGLFDEEGRLIELQSVGRDITGRLAAEQALRDSEERYRLMAENSTDMISKHSASGTYLYVSPSCQSLLGYEPGELLGRSAYEFFHPDDLAKILESHANILQGPDATSIVYRIRRRDGSYTWFETVSKTVTKAGSNGDVEILATSRDTSRRVKDKAAIMESEARYRSLYRKTPVMMHSIDAEGRLVSVSDYWLHKMGFSEEEVIGKKSIDFLTSESASYALNEVLPSFGKTGECRDVEYQFVKKNGQLMDVLLSAIAETDPEGRMIRSLAVLVDVTERKRLERDLIQAQRSESIGRVAGGIAHDINNLLAVTLPSAQLILDNLADPKKVTMFAEAVITSSKRAADILKQLLVFSRQTPVSKTTLDVNGVIHETAKLLDRLLGKNVHTILDLHSNLPFVDADSTQLQQVIINLCVNARDAMNDWGTINISSRPSLVDPEAASDLAVIEGVYVELKVSDTGTGIPDEALPHIFEPFYTTKDVGKGTGLGLPVIKTIVNNHNGYIRVETKTGAGTTFTVGLPVSKLQPNVADPAEPRPASGRIGRVLVADDEDGVREVARQILEKLGYQVRTAASGAESIRLFEEDAVDLVLLDVQMPGIDGIATLRQLQKIKADIRYVLMTGHITDNQLQEIKTHSPDLVLFKPFSVEQLSHSIERALHS